MSNVKFLRGPQGNLDKLSTFAEGAFYVTTDTDRMYFAQSANDLVYLNKHIINVPNINSLPNINEVNAYDFYYAEAENVLCTKLPDATQWTQINKNTDTYQDTFIDNVTFKAEVDENKDIIVNYTIGQKTTDQANAEVVGSVKAEDFTGSFKISKELIGQAQVTSAVDINSTIENGVATVKTSGVGAAGGADVGFTISGDAGVEISGNNDQIVISGQTYSLTSGADSSNITLKNKSGGNVGQISIKAGDTNNSIIVNGANENEIIVSHKDYGDSDENLNNQDLTNSTKPVLTIVSGVKLENGHVTEVKTQNVNLTADKISDISLNDSGNLVIQVVDANNANKYTVSSEDVFGYNAGNGFVKVGGNLNNYYFTKEEINNKFKSANALTFKGGVSTKIDSAFLNLPETEVSIGDVYIVEKEGIYGDVYGNIGDLFIAYSNVEEDENGYIISDNLEWTHVPSGNETIYTYDLGVNADDNAIILSDNANSKDSIVLADDDVVVAIVDGNDGNKINFSHAKIALSDDNDNVKELLARETFSVVTGVTVNDYGHVTGREYTAFTLPGENNLAIADNTITLSNSKNASLGQVAFNKGTLITPTTSENGIVFDHDKITDNSPAVGTMNGSLKDNTTFTIVESIVRDEYGHITAINTKNISLAAVNKFNQDVTVANNTLTITNEVRDSNNAIVENSTHTINVQSDSLKITKAENVIKAEIEWGTF